LGAKVRVLQARVRELEARYTEQRTTNLVKAAVIAEELRYASDDLQEAQRRVGELVVQESGRCWKGPMAYAR
jgi:hypothetical protein